MLNIGKNAIPVPRPAKRAVQVLFAVALTALASLLIVVGNGFLMAKSGWLQGFNAWYAFVLRPDILGTMILTAVVTVLYMYQTQSRKS